MFRLITLSPLGQLFLERNQWKEIVVSNWKEVKDEGELDEMYGEAGALCLPLE